MQMPKLLWNGPLGRAFRVQCVFVGEVEVLIRVMDR